MKDYQTPQKEHSRFTDSFSHRSKDPSQLKKPLKIAKKCLNGSFTSVSGRVSADSPKESCDISAIEEISDASGSQSQMTEDSGLALNPTLSSPTEAFSSLDLTPTSKMTSINNGTIDVDMENFGSDKSDRSQNGLVESDVLRNFLEKTGSLSLNRSSWDHQQKKLLDAFVKAVIDEYIALPDDRDRVVNLLKVRLCIVFLCCLVFTMALCVRLFFNSELHDSYTGPPPT